jgi:hypothetical protein
VRLIYEWAAESSSEPHVSPLADQAELADPMATGSTLTIEDLIPEWQTAVPPAKG